MWAPLQDGLGKHGSEIAIDDDPEIGGVSYDDVRMSQPAAERDSLTSRSEGSRETLLQDGHL